MFVGTQKDVTEGKVPMGWRLCHALFPWRKITKQSTSTSRLAPSLLLRLLLTRRMEQPAITKDTFLPDPGKYADDFDTNRVLKMENNAFNTRMAELEVPLQIVSTEHQNNTRQNQSLTRDLQAAVGRCNELNLTNIDLETTISHLQEHNAFLNERTTALETTNRNLVQRNMELRLQIESLLKQEKKLTDMIEKHESIIRGYHNEKQLSSGERLLMEAKSAQLKIRIVALEKANAQLQKAQEQFHTTKKNICDTNEDLKTDHIILQSSYAALENTVKELQEKYDALHNEKANSNVIQSNIDALETVLRNLQLGIAFEYPQALSPVYQNSGVGPDNGARDDDRNGLLASRNSYRGFRANIIN